ncbi:hypothetical protein HT585_12850 [Ensifer sp. HO-A22]|uniref:Uncharacterized protein n=1 Tax=Ensifer oleiphilus TaxID=2742698 RepID=A0A7Y6UNL7_9HYPH|nr:hypothetical protein [Ensifer oleiphilus]NVD39753.1 hypothetical protein [Ensifer oleiphilus]
MHEPEYSNRYSRRCRDHPLGGDVPNAKDERHRDRNGNPAGNHDGTLNSAVDNDSIHYGADDDRTVDHNTLHCRAIDNGAIDAAVHYPTVNHAAVDNTTGAIRKWWPLILQAAGERPHSHDLARAGALSWPKMAMS